MTKVEYLDTAQTWAKTGKPKLGFPKMSQTWPLCPTLGTPAWEMHAFKKSNYFFR